MTSNPEKVVYEKFYVHEIAAVDLSKIYFLKNAMKTCKSNNRDLNRDGIMSKKGYLTFEKGHLIFGRGCVRTPRTPSGTSLLSDAN